MTTSGIETIDFGTVTDWVRKASSHDFSDAITLVVTVSASAVDDPHPKTLNGYPTAGIVMRWWLYDSIDGNHGWSMEDTDGSYSGWLGFDESQRGNWNSPRLHSTRRFVVPFRPSLSMSVELKRPTRHGDERLEASLEDVKATIYWQGVD